MTRRRMNLIVGISALIFGAFIYIFVRVDTHISKIVCDFFGISIANQVPILCNWDFVRYYLPDALWAFSLASFVQVILSEFAYSKIISGLIAISCGVAWEFFQLLNVVSGTGDLMDVLMYLLAGLLSIYINRKGA